MTNTSDRMAASEGSRVTNAQRRSAMATRRKLAAVAADVHAGLSETVGVGATLSEGERASVVVELPTLPDEFTPNYLARAIDSENVEAWCDKRGRVHVAIGPRYSTKDIDQVVLSITKVVHVLLGLHATDSLRAGGESQTSFWRRLPAAAMDIIALQKRHDGR